MLVWRGGNVHGKGGKMIRIVILMSRSTLRDGVGMNLACSGSEYGVRLVFHS